jgi:uncharacterized ferritin-like protein (DUF455 family)
VRSTTPIPLDPTLFAESPTRDDRFVVKDRWIECANLPSDHPLHQVEFFHRQMNEEINGLEISARNLSDFPEADWELRMWLARQCADEARHAAMFRRILRKRGGHVGQYPVLNFQYRIITKIDNLVGRLAIQNRSFEAGGIDAIAFGIEEAKKGADLELAEFYEAQLADEIVHVRFANDWIRVSNRKDPRSLLQMGAALTAASKAFFQVMGAEGTQGVGYPADGLGRLEAGFSPDEVKMAGKLASSSGRSAKENNPEAE